MQLQNLDKQGERGSVERALILWQQRGALSEVGTYDAGMLYRVILANGDDHVLTLKEAKILVTGMALGSKATIAAQQSDTVHYTWQGVI